MLTTLEIKRAIDNQRRENMPETDVGEILLQEEIYLPCWEGRDVSTDFQEKKYFAEIHKTV